ncbi:superoxide dismutase, mitochondrial [Mayamaea pseudoterrestris]|nr:superoxide dismutase, mitochondrial [Mayamaea pseudoterrestris]
MTITKVLSQTALKAAVNLQSAKVPTQLVKSSAALFSAYGGKQQELPSLTYDYGALEPAISAETMTIHHTKHHATYVNNLNAAIDKLDAALSSGDVSGIISLQAALKFNGGGHLNHTLFWENLTPHLTHPESPKGDLATAIDQCFGSYDGFKKQMSDKTIAIQGSGWGWLGYNKSTGRLEIATCANQDPLQATTGLVPLLGIDVWEHAYYVDYRNVRPDYVKQIWDVIDWDAVEARLNAAK